MTKHTPGPWSAICEDVAGARLIGDDGVRFWTNEAPRGEGDIYRGCIACVWASRLNGGLTVEERDSNARLIAAAPDMLAALEEAWAAYSPQYVSAMADDSERTALDEAFDGVRTAIAKAKVE